MSGIHPLQNTSEDLPCTNCGGPGNVVREANVPEDKKLKCHRCGFMYTAADSNAAKAAGAIPDGEPQLDQRQGEGIKPAVDSADLAGRPVSQNSDVLPSRGKITRTPAYVLISKDRMDSEFANSKNVKQVILRWEYEEKKFDIYELTPKQAKTKVELQ